MNTTSRTLAGAALFVLLAGCSAPPVAVESPVAPPTVPAVSPSESPSPTPTPTPSPTVSEPDWTPPDPDRWGLVLDTDFDGSSMPDLWDYRLTGSYGAGGRWCASPIEDNVAFGDGVARLKLSEASEKQAAKVSAEAKRKQTNAGDKPVGCPEGVFGNAMISTQDQFSVDTGLVAARVKFPVEQGAHAGVWLQSGAQQEIDIIETYGWGQGLTNVVHVRGKKNPPEGRDSWVVPEVVADRAWWDAWHTVEVEWTHSKITFRLDGEVTRELKQKTGPADYFVVISLLSSDWETSRLTTPKARNGSGVDADQLEPAEIPFGMEVDWVRVWVRS